MSKKYQIQTMPRLFEQVAKQMVDFIRSENLKPGSKLPPERTLSQLLQVGRSSVREGLRVLELLKYLDSKQGEGTYVSQSPPFLLPGLVLQQKMDQGELNHYFAIAIMCAEKIIFLSLSNNSAPDRSTLIEWKDEIFWNHFAKFIHCLGVTLENPFYLSLWNSTYQLLEQNHFFHDRTVPFEMQQFVDAFLLGEYEEIRYFMHKLANNS